jgi:hypothetical protein
MSGEGRLMVRVDKQLDGDVLLHAVPVRIRRADRAPIREGLQTVSVAAPATLHAEWAVEWLPPGTYELEATLPSGELVTAEAKLAEGRDEPVVLHGSGSANEWRSWSHFSGGRDASPTGMAARGLKAMVERPPPDYAHSLGTLATPRGRRARFAADDWEGWHHFLLQRWTARTGSRRQDVELELAAPDPGLHVSTSPSQPGDPILICVQGHPWRVPAQDVGRTRNFLAVKTARGTRLLSLPWPWFPGEHSRRSSEEFLQVLVSETNHELLCDATIRDEHLGGLLAYLNAGRVGIAGELLKLARGALFDKYGNPLGAAAGGYVLLSTIDSDQLGDWPHWLENLAENFPHLPDGAILRSKWLLDRGGSADLPEAGRLLRDAFDRGVPFFTAGVAWLMEGLARVADGDDDEFSAMLRTVRAVARSIDLARGLTSFSLPALDMGGEGDLDRARSAPALQHSEMEAVAG